MKIVIGSLVSAFTYMQGVGVREEETSWILTLLRSY